jgi:hypothetical protein
MPYFGYLPEPAEIATERLRAALAKGEDLAALGPLVLTTVEAPSNYLAFDALRRLEVSVAHIPTPDPRVPRRPVDFLLWRFDDVKPKVAVPPPHPAIAWAVVEIAAQPYQLELWVKQAARLAQQLQPGHAADLLATMVYPPRPPQVQRPWTWVYGVQLAAALVITHIDDGWHGSVRRKALLALANGPVDWTTDAGLVALTVVALDDEEAAEEIAEVFRQMREELPQDGMVCHRRALLYGSLRLPNLGAAERAAIRQQLRTGQDDAL